MQKPADWFYDELLSWLFDQVANHWEWQHRETLQQIDLELASLNWSEADILQQIDALPAPPYSSRMEARMGDWREKLILQRMAVLRYGITVSTEEDLLRDRTFWSCALVRGDLCGVLHFWIYDESGSKPISSTEYDALTQGYPRKRDAPPHPLLDLKISPDLYTVGFGYTMHITSGRYFINRVSRTAEGNLDFYCIQLMES